MSLIPKGLAFLVTVVVFTAGCHSDSHPQSSSPWSGLVADLRYQWASNQDIDLSSGAAVPLRAYIESRTLAQSWGSLDYTYPGFLEAVPANADPGGGNIGERNRRPNTDHPLESARFGTSKYFVQSLTQSDQKVIATLCNYRYTIASQQADGLFKSVAATEVGPDRGIDTLRVTLAPPSSGAKVVLPPQNGPAPSPRNDVFAGWQITGFLSPLANIDSEFGVIWPTYEEDHANCVARAPDSETRRLALTEGEHPRSAFPTGAADPGWPETPSQ